MNHDGLLGHGQVLMTLSIDVGLAHDYPAWSKQYIPPGEKLSVH